ncbi:D-mandelate dehydrogenase-like dehydrogenase [Aspergillus mulundensis]|uniref:D-isomer specific 2-hydroxyacid dehydrogenase NAD-binding domain-containing protein n=1 Tax=Aspergillus mulundensis TaxID=1810919 RepID=A0A3D8T5U3_9EURO|nr:Uncharacterized protein DSM5745_01254 [Aspergillus mulundensis]RDW93932.1 Uncharacterized protein DSM5745_01254 [Aspergillus mulundensis]
MPPAEGTRKPIDILLIESPVQAIDHARRESLVQKYNLNLIYYDCTTTTQFKERLAPGGAYSAITAILRNGWLKAGPYAYHTPFSAEFIPHFPPSLKLICCSGHGHDTADIPALTARGIWYCNTPNACTEAVANTGLALVLDSFRYLSYAQWCARYDWMASRALGLKAVDPRDKVLGIVGLGDIGLAIGRKCESALGMRVVYTGPRRKVDAERQLAGGARFYGSVDEMIPHIDCVVLSAPYTPATHHVLSHGQFARAKSGGLRVVNVARGKMLDEGALLEALEAGKVVGVGLDVHEDEPGVNDQLKENWMVTLLPHIGVCSESSWEGFESGNWGNLESWLRTGRPETPVNWVGGNQHDDDENDEKSIVSELT